MPKKIIFKESLLLEGVMCFDGCGNTVRGAISAHIEECIRIKVLPADAQFTLAALPQPLGIHKLYISIFSEEERPALTLDFNDALLDCGFKTLTHQPFEKQSIESKWGNWLNILINILGMGIVITGALVFPPSVLLSIGLGVISFLTSAFSARQYLLAFLHNFKSKTFANMATSISLGWLLSLAHALYHSISMPMALSLSMTFMNFIMPILLITCINIMDEIKRLIMERSQKIQLQGLDLLLPQLSKHYECYDDLTADQLAALDTLKKSLYEQKNDNHSIIKSAKALAQKIKTHATTHRVEKEYLRAHIMIKVKEGACFPADCLLLEGSTHINASLLTGETYQSKKEGDFIPAGAINLGKEVIVYIQETPFDSAVNRILCRANRSLSPQDVSKKRSKFAYFYTALVLFALVVALITPLALGVATVPLLIEHMIGILFSLCPCTIAIGHELPKLLSRHQRSQKGIHLRDERLMDAGTDELHTFVFDKTGTLSTGRSRIESSDILVEETGLWQRIYLLEKEYGQAHPLAKAIQRHYEATFKPPAFTDVSDYQADEKACGFTAKAQGKTLHIGSHDFLKRMNISLPPLSPLHDLKMQQGLSVVCVAEEKIFKGFIYIQHEIRPGVVETLRRLKKQNKRLIMLTGDNEASAKGFNKQLGSIFHESDIHAGQTPTDKESFLQGIQSPKGVCFCGDGLNDAPCCRIISERGGISCAMNASDNAAFFTDISLNGSLGYLLKHHQLNRSLHILITQNKGILYYSTLALLAFIIGFSSAGIGLPSLIPMAIMLLMTFFVVFNSYRAQLAIDVALEEQSTWPKKLLSSNVSIGLLLSASTLLIAAVLIASISSAALALPLVSFTTSAVAISSVCALSAITLLILFTALLISSLVSKPAAYPKSDTNTPYLTDTACSEQEKAIQSAVRPTSSALFQTAKSSRPMADGLGSLTIARTPLSIH